MDTLVTFRFRRRHLDATSPLTRIGNEIAKGFYIYIWYYGINSGSSQRTQWRVADLSDDSVHEVIIRHPQTSAMIIEAWGCPMTVPLAHKPKCRLNARTSFTAQCANIASEVNEKLAGTKTTTEYSSHISAWYRKTDDYSDLYNFMSKNAPKFTLVSFL